jgi:hypothetical protein
MEKENLIIETKYLIDIYNHLYSENEYWCGSKYENGNFVGKLFLSLRQMLELIETDDKNVTETLYEARCGVNGFISSNILWLLSSINEGGVDRSIEWISIIYEQIAYEIVQKVIDGCIESNSKYGQFLAKATGRHWQNCGYDSYLEARYIAHHIKTDTTIRLYGICLC